MIIKKLDVLLRSGIGLNKVNGEKKISLIITVVVVIMRVNWVLIVVMVILVIIKQLLYLIVIRIAQLKIIIVRLLF